MKRKFKIGDKVKVIKKYGAEAFDGDFKVGNVGIITGIRIRLPYPYYIKRKDGKIAPFNAYELKLIKKGRKNGNKK